MTSRPLVLVSLLSLVACGDDSSLADGSVMDVATSDTAQPDTSVPDVSDEDVPADVEADAADGGMERPTTVGGDRPANIVVPTDYSDDTPAPVVVLLHGYGASGSAQDLYFQLSSAASERGMLTLLPDGTLDAASRRYWNGAGGCCAFAAVGSPPDDVAYIQGLVDELAMHYAVDRSRVYLVGHSNGGFMSYRMACEAPEAFTALAALAGTTDSDEDLCDPSEPVSVLHIHGTMDETIDYEGSSMAPLDYAGALETITRHAAYAGCEGDSDGDARDITTAEGSETLVSIQDGCDEGFGAELWTIVDGEHIPPVNGEFADQVLDWLLQWQKSE